MDFLWQTQDVQTEFFGTRAGDTTTLKITTQAIIGQIPTICRDMSTKVIWYKSSVWRQSPEHPNIICHGLKENTASSKKKIAPQVSSESPFFNENIKKFWTFLIVLWWTWRSFFAHEPYKLCNMLIFHNSVNKNFDICYPWFVTFSAVICASDPPVGLFPKI